MSYLIYAYIAVGLSLAFSSQETQEPTFYPKIMSRGVPIGRIAFYDQLTNLDIREHLLLPDTLKNSQWGNWTYNSTMAQTLARFFNMANEYAPPPFDRTLGLRGIKRTYEPFEPFEPRTARQVRTTRSPKTTTTTTTDFPIREENRNDSQLVRKKRDLPFYCSNLLLHAGARFLGYSCDTDNTKEVKKSLELTLKEQDLDRLAIQKMEEQIGISQASVGTLKGEYDRIKRLFARSSKDIYGTVESLENFQKVSFHLFMHIAAEIALSEIIRTYSRIFLQQFQGNLNIWEFPLYQRYRIQQKYAGTLTETLLNYGHRLLMHPEVWVSIGFEGSIERIEAGVLVEVPTVTNECIAYSLDRLGLETPDACLTGQEYRDIIVIDCGQEHGRWIAGKSCLEQCNDAGLGMKICHKHQCGADQKFQPDWLGDKHSGKLEADIEKLQFCQRQPTVVKVGQNQYLLTRTTQVTLRSNETEDVTMIKEFGSLIKTGCSRQEAFTVNGMSYDGSCFKEENAIHGRLRIENHDNLTLLDFGDIDTGDRENVTLGQELQGILAELGNQTYLEKLQVQDDKFTSLGHFVDTDMIKVTHAQRKLAEHIKMIKDQPVTFQWSDRILTIVIGIITFTSFLMSACALCGRTMNGIAIPIRNVRMNKRLSSSESLSKAEATAPMLSVEENALSKGPGFPSQWNDTTDFRGSTTGKQLDRVLTIREYDMTMHVARKPEFFNMTPREVAEFVMNTMRPNGIYYYDKEAWHMLGQERPMSRV